MLPATISWFAALTVCPAPDGPTCTIVFPTGAKISAAASKSAASPPTMMDSAAFFAPASPPETGASRMRNPRSFASFASSAVTSGRIEEKSMIRVPGLALSNTPPSPASTSRTWGESGTMTATTSASRTASAIEVAPLPPTAISASILSWLRSLPMTSNPAFTRWPAIGPPMMPRPMKATVVIDLSSSLGWYARLESTDMSGGRTVGQRQPGQAVPGAHGRLVLQRDIPVVALGRERGQVPVDVQPAGARLAAARAVGDLHVPDPIGVVLDGRGYVVAVDVQVVQVAEELDVGDSGGRLHPVDHPDHVGRGQQRVTGRPTDRLHQHHAVDPGHRPRGQRQILRGDLVLGRRRRFVGPVAVQRIERLAAQPLPDADDDVDVVPELAGAGRPGHQTAVAAGHVAGEEVQPDQLYPGVRDGADEGIDLGVRRHRGGERPPELDRVEPSLSGRGRPRQQRQFGEQHGQVDRIARGFGGHRESFGSWMRRQALARVVHRSLAGKRALVGHR